MPLISTKSSASAQGLGFTAQSGPRTAPISGYELWLDSSDASKFTYSSGTVISRWTDKSANAYAFEPPGTTYAPSRNGTQNSKSTVVFDGVDDLLTCTSSPSVWKFLHDGTQSTVFVVYKDTDTDNTSSEDFAILDTTGYEFSGVTAAYPGYTLSTSTWYYSTTSTWFVNADGEINSGVIASGQTYPSRVYTSGNIPSANRNTWNVHSNLIDLTNATSGQKMTTYNSRGSYPDYANTAVTLYNWSTPGTANPQSALRIGNYRPGSAYASFKGEIAEIIIYKRKLSVSEKTEMVTYLKNKWSV